MSNKWIAKVIVAVVLLLGLLMYIMLFRDVEEERRVCEEPRPPLPMPAEPVGNNGSLVSKTLQASPETTPLFYAMEEVVGDTLRFEFFNHVAAEVAANDTTKNKYVLVLSLIRDTSSWGESFEKFLDMLAPFDHPQEHMSLGFMTADFAEYEHMKETVLHRFEEKKLRYRHVTLMFRHQEVDGPSRESRHDPEVQKIRRRTIARLRNLLLYSTLRTQDAVLWIDSDIIDIPNNALSLMLKSNKDIITTRCQIEGRTADYDLNAWKGPRASPSVEELQSIREGGFWMPRPVPGETKQVWHLRDPAHPEPDFFVEIDSVGGTLLFVIADVFRQGVVFTTSYIIGTEWQMLEGWDGIETEGLCYLAKPLGYRCWAMPNVVTSHVNR